MVPYCTGIILQRDLKHLNQTRERCIKGNLFDAMMSKKTALSVQKGMFGEKK